MYDITGIQEQDDVLYEQQIIKIDKGQEPLRIDKFLMHRIERATRNKIQRAIAAGLVTVNGAIVKATGADCYDSTKTIFELLLSLNFIVVHFFSFIFEKYLTFFAPSFYSLIMGIIALIVI